MNDLGMPMDGQPAMFDIEITQGDSAEPVKPRRAAKTVKPWLPYLGGRIGCSDCIVESAGDRTQRVARATWTRAGTYGSEYVCDAHAARTET